MKNQYSLSFYQSLISKYWKKVDNKTKKEKFHQSVEKDSFVFRTFLGFNRVFLLSDSYKIKYYMKIDDSFTRRNIDSYFFDSRFCLC